MRLLNAQTAALSEMEWSVTLHTAVSPTFFNKIYILEQCSIPSKLRKYRDFLLPHTQFPLGGTSYTNVHLSPLMNQYWNIIIH